MKKTRTRKTQESRWTRDPVKEEYWRRQLVLWQNSGLSIRAFCKEHGVVESSFYTWRRELIIRARENGVAEELTSAERVTPNTLKDGRGRTIAIRYRQTDQPTFRALMEEDQPPNPFVPLKIVNEHASEATTAMPVNNGLAAIEISLPGGAVMRLNEHCNVRLVAELLSVLKG